MGAYKGIVIDKNDNYTIYSASSNDENNNIQEYLIGIPNNQVEGYSLYIDFPNKGSADINKEEMFNSIKNIQGYSNDSGALIVRPRLPEYLVVRNNDINDDKMYYELAISMILLCKEVFNEMLSNGVKMRQKVYLVSDTIYEEAFLNWMNTSDKMMRLGVRDIFKGIKLSTQENIQEYDTGDGTGNSLSGGPSISSEVTISKPKVKTLKPSSKLGFGSISGLILIVVLSLVVGVSIAIMMIK